MRLDDEAAIVTSGAHGPQGIPSGPGRPCAAACTAARDGHLIHHAHQQSAGGSTEEESL